MNPEIAILKQVFSSWWKTVTCAWAYRHEFLRLIDELEKLRAELHVTKDALHLVKLELEHAKGKLVSANTEHADARRNNELLLQFVLNSHRIDAAPEGSALKALQQLRKQP